VKKAALPQGSQSHRTAYKWLERYKENGEAALKNRNSRPQRSPR
jgi:transposase